MSAGNSNEKSKRNKVVFYILPIAIIQCKRFNVLLKIQGDVK